MHTIFGINCGCWMVKCEHSACECSLCAPYKWNLSLNLARTNVFLFFEFYLLTDYVMVDCWEFGDTIAAIAHSSFSWFMVTGRFICIYTSIGRGQENCVATIHFTLVFSSKHLVKEKVKLYLFMNSCRTNLLCFRNVPIVMNYEIMIMRRGRDTVFCLWNYGKIGYFYCENVTVWAQVHTA